MAASANLSPGGHSNASNGNNNGGKSNGGGKANAKSASGASATENLVVGPTQAALRHNPGLSLDWTPEEQSVLEDLLAKFASESNVVRYAKISQALSDQTVRGVALRCRWMGKKERGKRRKDDNSRKSKDKKEKVRDSLPRSSQVENCSNGPPYAQSFMSLDSDNGISFKLLVEPLDSFLSKMVTHWIKFLPTFLLVRFTRTSISFVKLGVISFRS